MTKKPLQCLLLMLALVYGMAASVDSANAQSYVAELREHLSRFQARHGGKVQVGVVFADAKSGETVFSHNGQRLMTPASVVKIITSFAALKILGAQYRFPTEFYVDRLPTTPIPPSEQQQKRFGATGNLYVRAYGDPSLIGENLWEWAHNLAALGVHEVEHVVIDDTLFIDAHGALGSSSYQAALSATSLNHNNYALHVTPTWPGKPAVITLTPGTYFALEAEVATKSSVRSDESFSVVQLPASKDYRRPLTPGRVPGFVQLISTPIQVRVRGAVKSSSRPTTRYYPVPDPAAYFGAVLSSMLKQAGITVTGEVYAGEVPAESTILETFESKDLGLIVRDLNHYSNNFIAGQLLFAMGQDSVGYFRKDVALARIEALLSALKIKPGTYTMVDASGLDRKNRLSAEQLATVLVAGYNDFSVAPVLLSSLSRFGRSGTLKKRSLVGNSSGEDVQTAGESSNLEAGVWGKTGTLNGVSSIAGYLQDRTRRRIAYAILVNGPVSKSASTRLEDELLKTMMENGPAS